jgi:hypothetical protein
LALTNISINTFALPTPLTVLFVFLGRYIPSYIMNAFFAHSTARRVRCIHELKDETTKVARVLLTEKYALAARVDEDGKGKRDVMSLIGQYINSQRYILMHLPGYPYSKSKRFRKPCIPSLRG